MITKKNLFDIIDDLLQDCKNETIDCEEFTSTPDYNLKMIYNNVELYTLKLKDKLNDIMGE